MNRRRNTAESCFMCMYHAATRKNFTAAITASVTMMRFELTCPSRYDVATSTAVSTTRTTAMSTYWRGPGCECSSAGTRCCSPAGARVPPCSSAATGSSSERVTRSVVSLMPASSVRRDQIDRGEDEDPHDVDEVPVEPGDLHGLRLLARQPSLHRAAPDEQQPDDSHRDVRAMQPRQHEERRAEHVRAQMQALAVELGELVHLAADERRPEQTRGEQPDAQASMVAALDGGEREHHRQRAHEQHERRDRRERDVQELVGRRAAEELRVAAAIQEVRR